MDDSFGDLAVGECIDAPGFTAGEIESVDAVDCAAGTLEVIDRFEIEGDDYPGDDAVGNLMGSRCPLETVYTIGPTKDSWEKADDRLVLCFGGFD